MANEPKAARRDTLEVQGMRVPVLSGHEGPRPPEVGSEFTIGGLRYRVLTCELVVSHTVKGKPFSYTAVRIEPA